MFLKDPEVKKFLLLLWAKYKNQYGVKIFEFNLMDNHIHLLLRIENVESLGHFMRTVNSQLARFINKHFKRDSQAIRERYKSPVITTTTYFNKVRSYIWLNRYRINKKSNPLKDLYCSASWHVQENAAKILGFSGKELKLFDDFLEPHHDEPPASDRNGVKRFFHNLLTAAISILTDLDARILCHGHTIGDKDVVAYRGEVLNAFRREHVPWVKSDPPSQLSYGV